MELGLKIQSFEAEMDGARQNYQSLNKQYEDQGVIIQNYQNEIEDLRSQIEAHKSNITALNQSIKDAKESKKDLENKIFVQKQDIQELQDNIEQLKLKHIQDLKLALKSQMEDQVAIRLSQLDLQRKEYEKKLKEKEQEKIDSCNSLKDQIKQLEDSFEDRIKVDKTFFESKRIELEEKIFEMSDEKSKLSTQLRTANSLVADKEAEINNQLMKIQSLNEMLATKEQENTKLGEKMIKREKSLREELDAKHKEEMLILQQNL